MSKLTYGDYQGFLKSIDIQPTAFYDYNQEDNCLVEKALEDMPSDCLIRFTVDKNNDTIKKGRILLKNCQPVFCLDVYGIYCDLCEMINISCPSFIKNINEQFIDYLTTHHFDFINNLVSRKNSMTNYLGTIYNLLEELEDSDLPSSEITRRMASLNFEAKRIKTNIKYINTLPQITHGQYENSLNL